MRENTGRGGAGREWGESLPSRLHIVNADHDAGLEPLNCEILIWVEIKSQTLNQLSHPGAPEIRTVLIIISLILLDYFVYSSETIKCLLILPILIFIYLLWQLYSLTFFLFFFTVYLLLRAREREWAQAGEGQERKRDRDRESEAGFALSAQSLTWGSNLWARDHDLSWS